MGYLEAIIDGLRLVLAWPNILYPIGGTLLAMVVSFLPGIGGTTLMALALPLTLSWEPLEIVLLYGALVGGATFMGSITAILFNVPGAAPNAATMLDGHPMARRGEALTAIGCAATASGLGSLVGIGILIATLPLARDLLLRFGPLEFLLLGLWGLTTVVMVTRGPALKGAAMVGLGLALALVGRDPRTAEPRFTLGTDYLLDGIHLVPLLLGIFAVAEALALVAGGRRSLADVPAGAGLGGSVLAGARSILANFGLFLRCSVIGSLIGIVPGIGGTVASFVAYGHAAQSARPPRRFGDGDLRGVLAPEAAHDAKDGGSLLPVLAFGLPGSEGTAILLVVLVIHGFVPGRELLEHQLPMVFALIWSLLLSNLLTSLLGVACARPLARLTHTGTALLVPIILGLVGIAALTLRGNALDLQVALLAGLVGYLLQRFGWPRVPLVIAFVLATLIEDNLLLLARLLALDRIDVMDRPVALVLLVAVVGTTAWAVRQSRIARTVPPAG